MAGNFCAAATMNFSLLNNIFPLSFETSKILASLLTVNHHFHFGNAGKSGLFRCTFQQFCWIVVKEVAIKAGIKPN